MLSAEEIAELKQQLAEQIAHLPQAQKEKAQEQIDALSPEALESMLKQQTSKKSILRMIVDSEVAAKKIEENKEAIAVIEIRPISKGHVMILPRHPVAQAKNMPPAALTLARKVAKKIALKLQAKGVEIQTETKFGEQIINVIPYYDKPLSISSPRYEAKETELEQVYLLLRTIKRLPTQKAPKKTKSQDTTLILRRRIP